MQMISSTLNLQYLKPACTFSLNVHNLATPNKDELYRQLTIEVKGHDKAILNSYQKFTAMAAEELDVNITKIYEPPKAIARMSLMKSVFVHKKHFHQYEMRTLYRVFEIKNITGSTADTFLEYIQRNLPEGMAMKVTKHQIEKFPEHIKPPSTSAKSDNVAQSLEEGSPKSTEDAKFDQNTSKPIEATESVTDTNIVEPTTASTGIVHSSKMAKPKKHSKKSSDVKSGSADAPTDSSDTIKSKTKRDQKSGNPADIDS
ncbi:unnamed protein product [Candidula unifasciata]|uniref:Small ribosomal subunit protein uS10m n=1 Tax=Candidula unifasciata TaxID=100452 RepID=A0A8S3YJQ1_9EUPU|nr:unnamed protein product [Candidula unifasciata]